MAIFLQNRVREGYAENGIPASVTGIRGCALAFFPFWERLQGETDSIAYIRPLP